MKNWSNLSDPAKEYINQRFSKYSISGKEAFNESNLFPEEIKELNSEEIVEILKSKDISHVMPTSEYPELFSDINNIYLEDSFINRARGAEIVSENEFETAKADYFEDITDFEESLDVLDTLPDILIGSTTIGLGVSTVKAYDKIKKGEIDLFEAPRYILVDSGGKIIRCALIGISISSGSVILVSGAFAYVLYKSRNLLSKIFNTVKSIAINENTKRLAIGIISLVESDKYEILSQEIKKLNKNSLDSYNYLAKDLRKELEKLEPESLKRKDGLVTLDYANGRDNYSLVAKTYNNKLNEFIDAFFWGDNPIAYNLTQEQRNSFSSVFHFYHAILHEINLDNSIRHRMIQEKLENGGFNQKPTKQKGCAFSLVFIIIIMLNIFIILT